MENVLYELRPNVLKSLLASLGKVVLIAAVFIGGFYYLSSIGIFEVFIELINGAGLDISQNMFKVSFPLGVAFVAFIAALLNYVKLSRVRYVCYPDHLSIYKNFMIFQLHETNIPYWNIKSIVSKKDSIVIEAAGLKKGTIDLESVDNPAEELGKIQTIIRNFQANYYADYIKQQRIKNIAEEY
jgi:hypothetical protein